MARWIQTDRKSLHHQLALCCKPWRPSVDPFHRICHPGLSKYVFVCTRHQAEHRVEANPEKESREEPWEFWGNSFREGEQLARFWGAQRARHVYLTATSHTTILGGWGGEGD